jgi:hypothetical protein
MREVIMKFLKVNPQLAINVDAIKVLDIAGWEGILAKLLLDARPDLFGAWSTDTDREIDYVKPRLEEDRYE